MATTEEVVVTGDPWASWYGDQSYLQSIRDAVAAAQPQHSFAPPVPTVLPEFVVQPPAPAPAPAPPPPPPAAPVSLPAAIVRALPWLSFLVPMAGGPPGTGDAPDESSAVADRGAEPPPPPPIDPVLEEPEQPPDWWELGQGGDSSLLPPKVLTGVPIPEVEMPPGEPFFDVTPPRVTNPSIPFLPNVFDVPIFTADPRPRPAPTPVGTPRSDPIPVGDPFEPTLEPFSDPVSLPTSTVAPDVFGDPLADPLGDIFRDPLPAPELPAGTGPSPRIPDIWADPGSPVPDSPITPFDDPLSDPTLVEFGPTPVPPDQDTCSCANKKPKKKKKKSERDVCYRGTYVQRKKGISYHKIEQVPCEAAPRKAAAKRKPTAAKRKPRKRKQTWRDVLDQVFT